MISHTRSANYMPTNFCGTFRSALPLQVFLFYRAEGEHYLEEGPLPFWSPEWDPKNCLKKEPPLEGPLGCLLALSAAILVPKVSQKGAKRRLTEGSKTELNPGPPKKQEKVSSTHYLLCFSHVERSKKHHFLY